MYLLNFCVYVYTYVDVDVDVFLKQGCPFGGPAIERNGDPEYHPNRSNKALTGGAFGVDLDAQLT